MSDLEPLKQALAVSPENVPLRLMLAGAFLEHFQLEESREQYEEAVRIDPANIDARLGVVNVVNLQGRTSEAVVRLDQICRDAPNHAPAWMLRARLALQEGSGVEARAHYEQAVSQKSSLADAELLKRINEAGGTGATDPAAPTPLPVGDGFVEAQMDPDETGEFEPTRPFDDIDIEYSAEPNSDFSKVGGMEDVKENIRMKILYPLQNKELFEAYGKKAGGGVLLYGPPGCGKTLISKATAGEMDAKYISLGLHQILDMWIGGSEKRLHEIFEFARAHAPAVLFFDEVDALAADRKDMRTSSSRTLINQFLAELDGDNGDNDGVLVLGATNAPWHLDSAFLRPGRFDRIIFVPPPDQPAKEAIMKIMAEGKPVCDLDPQTLAAKMKDFSGADIKAVFDQAIEDALAEAMKSGKIEPVTPKQLMKAAKQTKPSTRKWFESAKNYALYSNQSGFYDDVLEFLGLKK